MNKSWVVLLFLLLVACTPQQPLADQPATEESCMDNLDRFSGTYELTIVSRELGIQDYAGQGEEICGPGVEYFGGLPTSATITVSGNTATFETNINSKAYSGSGTFKGPTEPKKPLVGGTFYEKSSSVTPGVNSCGTKSPYFTVSKDYAEDGGQTSLNIFVYGQEDAINIVSESFWIADDSEILSRCHGVVILQGTKLV